MKSPRPPARSGQPRSKSDLEGFIEALARWCAAVDTRASSPAPRRSRWAKLQHEQDAEEARRKRK